MTNNLHGSFVMEEFIKIAKDQGFISSKLKKDDENVVGNPKTETPCKDHRRYEPTEEYDVTKDDDIINKAHPDKKVQTAESNGEGGVVENIQEQQAKDIEAATNMPSGTLVGVHAEVINNLVKLANYYDSIGNSKTADKIDAVIKKIHHPFDNSRLHKEAFWPVLLSAMLGTVAPLAFDYFMNKGKSGTTTDIEPATEHTTKDKDGNIDTKKVGPKTTIRPQSAGVGSKVLKGVGAAGAAFTLLTILGRDLTSFQEDLKTDSKDLIDALNGFGDTAPSALRAAQMLTKFNNEIQTSNTSDDKVFNKLIIDAKKIKSDLPKIEQLILRATEVEDSSYTPYGEAERVAAKFDDFKASLEKFEKTFAKMESVGDKLDSDISSQTTEGQEAAPVAQDIVGVQELLSKRGFAGKTWNVPVSGEMDEATVKALTEIQNEIQQNPKVQQFAKSKGLKGSFSILKGDQLVADANNLEQMFKFVEEKFI